MPNKNLLKITLLVLLIVCVVFAFLLMNKKTLFGQPKVFASNEQCEKETTSHCIHYLCDIPIGDVYQRLCTNGPGTGWYNDKDLEK